MTDLALDFGDGAICTGCVCKGRDWTFGDEDVGCRAAFPERMQ